MKTYTFRFEVEGGLRGGTAAQAKKARNAIMEQGMDTGDLELLDLIAEEAPAGTPDDTTRLFHVTAHYATPSGNEGSWSEEVEATWATVFAVAEAKLRKQRRNVSKLNMDACELKKQGR